MTESAETQLRDASLLMREGRREDAIEAYRDIVRQDPGQPVAWYNLGYLLRGAGRLEEALEAYANALTAGIDRPQDVHLNRAVIYSDHLRKDDAAERELESALAVDPDFAPALLNLGNLHEERGRRSEAIACYERLLDSPASTASRRSLQHQALARMAHLRPPSGPDDSLLQRLRDASIESAADDQARANVLFALGRAYDTLGASDDAFDSFSKGHRCVRKHAKPYDRALARSRTDALAAVFNGEASTRREFATRRPMPVFICGMFRSGSTLVEQMLAAHPRVSAGGELDLLPRMVAGVLAPFPRSMITVDDEREQALAGDYLAQLAALFPESGESAYVTDKRPDNFLLIGLIKRLFPSAKIIHTVRHPLDNSLSIFMQHLDPRVASYSHELGDIGHYYGQYRRLMAHWKAQYGDDILDVDYDALVRDPRAGLERLLGFLGLDWDERCLDFHRLDNTVKTASYWQVRRPLYMEATGRWRRYHAHLVPLRAALREAGVPEADDS